MIFTYHAVVRSLLEVFDWCFLDEASFRKQLRYINKHFEVLPLSEAIERLSGVKRHQPMAAITFDDGFQNIYDVAYPILKEFRIPATIFPATGFIDTNDTLWYCRINRALTVTNKSSISWDGCKYDLSSKKLKAKAAAIIQDRIKRLKHPQLLQKLQEIILELGDDSDFAINIGSPYRMLSHSAISEMVSSGLIEFGAHTHNHAILSLLTSEEQEYEIGKSINMIQELTGHTCELFAYPNGRKQDYDEESIRILRRLGIRACVTTESGKNNEGTPLSELLRCEFSIKRNHFLYSVQAYQSRISYKMGQIFH